MENNVKVTIWCTAYNHENYIRAALEGFVRQKTNFRFIALVHDDASTDGTPDIIREYAERYPDIIKPIYQKENQYSQGISIGKNFLRPVTKSPYIAICEGDDCWIDDYKLQKQIDALEQHKELDICGGVAEGWEKGRLVKYIEPYKGNEVVTVEQLIVGKKGFPATASLVIRTAAFDVPWKFRQTALGGFDYFFRLAGSMRGGLLFLGDVLSVYNMNVPGSYSVRNRANRQKEVKFLDKVLEVLEIFNEETDYKYAKSVLYKNAIERYAQCRINNDYMSLYKNKKLLRVLSLERQLRITLKCFWR